MGNRWVTLAGRGNKEGQRAGGDVMRLIFTEAPLGGTGGASKRGFVAGHVEVLTTRALNFHKEVFYDCGERIKGSF